MRVNPQTYHHTCGAEIYIASLLWEDKGIRAYCPCPKCPARLMFQWEGRILNVYEEEMIRCEPSTFNDIRNTVHMTSTPMNDIKVYVNKYLPKDTILFYQEPFPAFYVQTEALPTLMSKLNSENTMKFQIINADYADPTTSLQVRTEELTTKPIQTEYGRRIRLED